MNKICVPGPAGISLLHHLSSNWVPYPCQQIKYCNCYGGRAELSRIGIFSLVDVLDDNACSRAPYDDNTPELLTNDGLVPGVHHTGQLVTVMVKSDEIIASIRAQTLALSAPSGAIRIVQGNMYYAFL